LNPRGANREEIAIRKIIFFDTLMWHYWCHISTMLDWQLFQFFFFFQILFNIFVFALRGAENVFLSGLLQG